MSGLVTRTVNGYTARIRVLEMRGGFIGAVLECPRSKETHSGCAAISSGKAPTRDGAINDAISELKAHFKRRHGR